MEQQTISYFARPVLTDLQTREKAKRERLNIDDVLPAAELRNPCGRRT